MPILTVFRPPLPGWLVQPEVQIRRLGLASVLGPEDRQNFSPDRKVRVYIHTES